MSSWKNSAANWDDGWVQKSQLEGGGLSKLSGQNNAQNGSIVGQILCYIGAVNGACYLKQQLTPFDQVTLAAGALGPKASSCSDSNPALAQGFYPECHAATYAATVIPLKDNLKTQLRPSDSFEALNNDE